jgi:hypothetical protein
MNLHILPLVLPTTPSNCFCVIWACISSFSSFYFLLVIWLAYGPINDEPGGRIWLLLGQECPPVRWEGP